MKFSVVILSIDYLCSDEMAYANAWQQLTYLRLLLQKKLLHAIMLYSNKLFNSFMDSLSCKNSLKLF